MEFRRLVKPLVLSILVLALALLAGRIWLGDLPALDTLSQRLSPPSVRITDRNGRILYEAMAQGGSAQDAGRHAVVPLDSIPMAPREATIATEDKDFYQNPGVDWRGMAGIAECERDTGFQSFNRTGDCPNAGVHAAACGRSGFGSSISFGRLARNSSRGTRARVFPIQGAFGRSV